ncbi:MAG TPA: FAD-binding oxidoreductase [Solirubrobacteraceae bacterium]|nr:FAD-binding oxidoreductase [Solirubrobacteraceae bacterium]
MPSWQGHRPGQHVDVRLTAEDGYEAQRSYSLASAPEDEHLALTVERLADGEVSPYLADELRAGDELELRGPIGGYFIWDESTPAPPVMLAGGSGVVPFRAILRHWAEGSRRFKPQLVYSARSFTDLIYRDELSHFADDGVDITIALTREWPQAWSGHRGRVDRELLESLTLAGDPIALVCGSNAFVESVSRVLVDLGQPADRIRTERFGPSGAGSA